MKLSGTRSGALLTLLTLCCLGIIRVAEGSVLQSLLYIPDEEPDCSLECRGLHRSYWPRCCETHNTCCQEFVDDCIADCRPRVALKGESTIAEERPGMCCYMYNLCCTREVFRINPIVRGSSQEASLPIVHRFSGGSADFHANSAKRGTVEEEQALREKQVIEEAKRKLLSRPGGSTPRGVATRDPLPEGVRRVPNLRQGGIRTKQVSLPAKQQQGLSQQEQESTQPSSSPRRVIIRNRPKPRDREENNRAGEEANRNRPESIPPRQGIASNRQNIRDEQENVGERHVNINTIPDEEYTAQESVRQENINTVRQELETAPEALPTEEAVPLQETKSPVREYVEIRRGPAPEEEVTERQNVNLAQDSIGVRSETEVAGGQGAPDVIQDDIQVR
ncbi:uncharacterized protein LOC143022603 [Oratosquilla oratoria]|uniref:uncharacterized protein LOC143022603 n=1 Tax=Oratosquilla oratoria TaxID=337810 RepID=UPI003F775F13